MNNLNQVDKTKYWNGSKNKAIRYYYYIQKGLALLNEFRYLVMAIFMMYHFLKVDNILLIPLMFIIAIPVLIAIGWLSVHHIEKVLEFLNVQYTTHFSRYSISLSERTNDLLEKIESKLK